MPNKKILIVGAAVALLFVAAVISLIGSRTTNKPINEDTTPTQNTSLDEDTTLTMWGVFDDSAVMQPLIAEYEKTHPGTKIVFVKKQFRDYEKLLVDAIASGQGPDLFVIQNDWLPKHRAKIAPMPNDAMSADQYQQTYVASAYDDFVVDGRIYALPLYTDNLALYYNRRAFSNAEIYEPPATWDEVTNLIERASLTQTAQGNPEKITRASIAIGTHNNIARAQDILLAMMMQTQTPIISDDRRSFDFNQFRKDPDGTTQYPGTQSLQFFSSFSSPRLQNYSWNMSMGSSIDAFARGDTVMMLGYSYMASQIEQKNPNLSYAIAPLPQIRGTPQPVTIANYWAWTVTRNAKNPDVAWDFLQFLSNDQTLGSYLAATNRVSPKKSTRASSSAFATQADIARTVYKGNSDEFDKIILELIQNVVQYGQPLQVSIDSAVREANEMLKRYN